MKLERRAAAGMDEELRGDRTVAWRGRRLVCGLLVALVLLGAGCLDFERQTIVVAPTEQDEIRCLFVYEGLHASGEKPADLEKAKEQLSRFVRSEREFCLFSNWPGHFVFPQPDTEITEEEIREAIDKEGGKRWKAFEIRWRALTHRHVLISNGGFFFNKDGRLCGFQTVTFRGASKYLEGVNALFAATISEAVAENAKKPPEERSAPWDEESLRLVQSAVDKRHTWFAFERGRIRIALVGSSEFFRHVKREVFAADNAGEAQKRARFFSENPVSVEEGRNHLTFTLGYGDGRPFQLRYGELKQERGAFEVELTEFARTLAPFDEKATTESVVEDFLKNNAPQQPR